MPKDEVKYLRSLQAIRKRAAYVNEAAKANALSNFDFHENTLDRVADDVADIIQVKHVFELNLYYCSQIVIARLRPSLQQNTFTWTMATLPG